MFFADSWIHMYIVSTMNISSKNLNRTQQSHVNQQSGSGKPGIERGKSPKPNISNTSASSGAPIHSRSLEKRKTTDVSFTVLHPDWGNMHMALSKIENEIGVQKFFNDNWGNEKGTQPLPLQINNAFTAISSDNDVSGKILKVAQNLVGYLSTVHEEVPERIPEDSILRDENTKINIRLGATACLENILQNALITSGEKSDVADECRQLLKDVTQLISSKIQEANQAQKKELVDELLGTLQNAFKDDFTNEIDGIRVAGNELLPIFREMYQQFEGSDEIQNQIAVIFKQILENAIKAGSLEQSGVLKQGALNDVAKVIVDAHEKGLEGVKELLTTAAKYDAQTTGETIYRSIWNFIKSAPGASYRKTKQLLTSLGLKIERFGGKVRKLPVIRQSVDQLETATVNLKKKVGGAFSKRKSSKPSPKNAKKWS